MTAPPSHRGPLPEDRELFAAPAIPGLRAATADLSWLLGRGYAEKAALKLVGDRHALVARQRTAIHRAAAADAACTERLHREVPARDVSGQRLVLDGYNLLVTVESALAGAVLLRGRDGCLRDLASVHGAFREVAETEPALRAIGHGLVRLGVRAGHFLLDRPVSHSARLRAHMLRLAAAEGFPWTVELAPDPDAALSATWEIVATSDSAVLDRCGTWFNAARALVDPARAWIVDLGAPG